MAVLTQCQTPGAQIHTHITPRWLTVTFEFGRTLRLTEEQAVLLEANAHNALEMVMAKYYVPEPAYDLVHPDQPNQK